MCVLGITANAQVEQQARFKILHEVITNQAATRIGMPFGDNGVELSDAGVISQNKLADEIKKRGESVPAGKFVTITGIEFSDRAIEVELDGGGNKKGPGILSRIGAGLQNGIGGGPPKGTTPQPIVGSKIVLKFAGKAPTDLTSAALRQLLDPILDFGRRPGAGVDGVAGSEDPGEVIKEARIGMDHAAVIRALGRPNNRVRETVNGVEREDWIYNGPGLRTTFVTFENDVVVGIREYER
ncbi:MAG TPA: hypothetical protein VFY29_16460 [Terriglobia bacterium]|nr:hypothetical protein [Terriglobia bacterium]